MIHPEFTMLFEIATGRLNDENRREIEAHLAACDGCRQEAASAMTLWHTVRADRMLDPSADLVSRAVSLWKKEHPGMIGRAVRQGRERAREAVEAIRAVLVFDSFTSPSPATAGLVRSGRLATSDEEPRRMLFRAGEIDIDLAIESKRKSNAGTIQLRGQILGLGDEFTKTGGAEVIAAPRKGRVARAAISGDGMFVLQGLKSGPLTLTLVLDARHIVLEGVDLNQPRQ